MKNNNNNINKRCQLDLKIYIYIYKYIYIFNKLYEKKKLEQYNKNNKIISAKFTILFLDDD